MFTGVQTIRMSSLDMFGASCGAGGREKGGLVSLSGKRLENLEMRESCRLR